MKIGAIASVAGGPVGRESTAATDLFSRAEILRTYALGDSLLGSPEGSTLRPDNRANRKLYGKDVSAKAIVLQGEVSPPSSALELLSVLNSKSPSNRSAGGAAPPPPPNHPPLSAYAQGEKTNAKGLITARTGDTIVLKTTDGKNR